MDIEFDTLLENTMERDFIDLMDMNVSDEWFHATITKMIGDDWYQVGTQILIDENREDLIPNLDKYAGMERPIINPMKKETPEKPEEKEEKPVKKEEKPAKAPKKPEIKKEDKEGDKGEKFLQALRSLKSGMESTYKFQNKMRQLFGQDWQPKALIILDEIGEDDDKEKFESVAYQAVPKDEK